MVISYWFQEPDISVQRTNNGRQRILELRSRNAEVGKKGYAEKKISEKSRRTEHSACGKGKKEFGNGKDSLIRHSSFEIRHSIITRNPHPVSKCSYS